MGVRRLGRWSFPQGLSDLGDINLSHPVIYLFGLAIFYIGLHTYLVPPHTIALRHICYSWPLRK